MLLMFKQQAGTPGTVTSVPGFRFVKHFYVSDRLVTSN